MPQSLHLDRLFDLQGRVALVTGGGTGIGLMIAEGLATNGAKVYITGRRKDVLENAAAQFAREEKGFGSLIPLAMNVTDKESISAGKHLVEANDGKLHILVNKRQWPHDAIFNDLGAPEHMSPETLGSALFDSASFDDWKDVVTVNAFSVYFVSSVFLGLLAKGSEDIPNYASCIINLGSISGNIKLAQNKFAYNLTKGAVTHLTKMLATELALKKINVRVNSVSPGVFESEMTTTNIIPETVDIYGQGIFPVPADRPGTTQEIAGTVIYLVSRAGCYTNGQEIMVDGGYTTVNPSLR